jgi:hypothetical protein
MEEAKGKKYSRNYVQWTPEMDRALLDVLVEHRNNGGPKMYGSHTSTIMLSKLSTKSAGWMLQRRKSFQGAKLLTSTTGLLAKF